MERRNTLYVPLSCKHLRDSFLSSYLRREGPELTRRIPLPVPSERLFENAVLIDY